VVGEKRNSQILVNLPVTDVLRYTSSNAKTLGVKYLQLPNVASCSEPPDGARIVHHGTVEQNTVPDGKATPPVQERTQHTQPLRGSFLYLVDVRPPGQSFIEGHTQIAGCINPYNWLPEQ
jgi:hypothetical protein